MCCEECGAPAGGRLWVRGAGTTGIPDSEEGPHLQKRMQDSALGSVLGQSEGLWFYKYTHSARDPADVQGVV